MERELWNELYIVVKSLDNTPQSQFYRNWEIVMVYLWAVIHDRPTSWAVDPDHWLANPLIHRLPSQSTLSRRLRTGDVIDLMSKVEQHLGTDTAGLAVWCIDGKPLPVGAHSKDREARLGFCSKGFQKGYKFHAIWTNTVIPSAWCIESMNVGEAKVAQKLVKSHSAGGYLLGDCQYDSNPLHTVTSQLGIQLVAPQKRKGNLGSRKHSTSRLHSLELLNRAFGKALYEIRRTIEQCFGNLTTFGGGLGPLPAWVRRKHRVHLWVQAKILINAMRIIYKNNNDLLARA